jgi:hypothetical protein
MGTRCIIKVEGLKGVCVYKHWDGYPKGTLPWLKDFNKKFTEERGFDDPEYKFAQLLRSSAFDCKKFNLGKDRATGWGVIPIKTNNEIPFDIAYVYILKKDGKVKTYRPREDKVKGTVLDEIKSKNVEEIS